MTKEQIIYRLHQSKLILRNNHFYNLECEDLTYTIDYWYERYGDKINLNKVHDVYFQFKDIEIVDEINLHCILIIELEFDDNIIIETNVYHIGCYN